MPGGAGAALPPQGPGPMAYQTYPQTLGISPQPGLWSTGLFDCFQDGPTCCLTFWCPCITFGQAAEIIDRGSSSCGVTGALYAIILLFTGLQCIYSCTYRTKLKQQYGMPPDTFEDFCLHCWCHGCALCQEYRELQIRGFDVPLGWHGNVERMNKATAVTNPPVVHGGMMR
ncbi:hypothetical protein RND81_03G176000 [Saponaria officinalis]|uniref:Uncharacterized protein n=1 Tax=Saponaria officinalis TaxID=3572 RepID=A0AAW1M8Y6_SAPOF